MRKIFSICIATLLFSCNDGDVIYKELNFDSSSIQKCSTKDLYFKINGKEMMILKTNNDFLKEQNINIGESKSFGIGSGMDLIYRMYEEVAKQEYICDILPPSKPAVVKEMYANPGGTIVVNNDMRTSTKDNDQPVSVLYFYVFNFNFISFKSDEIEIKYDENSFGEFQYDTNILNFKFDGKIKSCVDNKIVVNTDSEAMVLNFSTDAFQNSETPENQPVIINLSEENSLTYKTFDIKGGAIDAEKACSNEVAFGETIQKEKWIASEGVVKIITTKVVQSVDNTDPKTEFLHKITLENVVFTKSGEIFNREIIDFGEITTVL